MLCVAMLCVTMLISSLLCYVMLISSLSCYAMLCCALCMLILMQAGGSALQDNAQGLRDSVQSAQDDIQRQAAELADGLTDRQKSDIYRLIARGQGQDPDKALEAKWKPKPKPGTGTGTGSTTATDGSAEAGSESADLNLHLDWGMELVCVEGRAVWASVAGAVQLRDPKIGLRALDKRAAAMLQSDSVEVYAASSTSGSGSGSVNGSMSPVGSPSAGTDNASSTVDLGNVRNYE